MKLKLLFFALALFLCSGGILNAQIYVHNFEGTLATPYLAAPNTFDANLSASSWNTSAAPFVNFAGASGLALAINNSSGTPTYTLTFNVASGYSMSVNSFSFWRVRSNTGAQNWSMTINGISVGSGTVPTTGANTGTLTVSNPVQNLTGTVTIVLSLSGASGTGTFRLDDFTLNGLVTNAFITAQNGPWTTTSTWVGGVVPTSAQNVIIAHAVTDSSGLTRDAGSTTTVNSAGTLTLSSTMTSNGAVVVDGQLLLNAGFQNNGTLTCNNVLQINSGGFIGVKGPVYGSASKLIYNTGGVYGRGYEWSANGIGTLGVTPGYPFNITLSNTGTTLNYINGSPGAVGNKALAGTLMINAGTSLYMDYGTSTPGGYLAVGGNVIVSGNLSLGQAVGDDLRIAGDFTVSTGANFYGNNRAIYFTKNGTQLIIPPASGLNIPYIVFAPASGNTTVRITGNVNVTAPAAGNAISFSSASDVFDINGQTLAIGTAGVANTISGTGTFSGSTASNLTLLGAGSIGAMSFKTGAQILGTLTLNRTSAATAVTLGTPLTIDTTLALTNGLLDVGNYPLTFGASAGQTVSAVNYIIAEKSASTPNAAVRKIFTAGGSGFNWRIGDGFSSPNGSEFTAATTFISGGTFAANAYISMAVVDAKEPNFDGSDYISRYWEIVTSGITGTPTINGSFYYTDADIVGTEATMLGNSWNGTAWLNNGNVVNAASNQFNVNAYPLGTTHVTAGLRDVDINVKGVVGSNPSITSGDVTPSSLDNTLFAAQTIGSSQTKTFRIENVGNGSLSVSSISLSGVNPGDFSIAASTPYSIAGATGYVDFTITFQPTASGVRTAIVSIVSNDPTSSENPYTFMVQGTGDCPTSTNTVTPASGPAGTLVTITASGGNLTGATVSFNGVAAASVTQVSATQITAVVPVGAATGNLVTTNALGCQTSNTFTVINNVTSGCQGGNTTSDLFISEVTDSTIGGLTYVEIYNGTGASVNMAGYQIRTYSNGSSSSSSTLALSGTLAANAVYIAAVGISSSPSSADTCTGVANSNGQLAQASSVNGGINFDVGGNDALGLYKISSSSVIDAFGTIGSATWADGLGLGDRGATFRRKNNVTVPTPTFSASNWNIVDWAGSGAGSCGTNDYSDIGTFNFLAGTPPTITTQPTYSPSCKATSFTVAATEGFSGGNSLAYQWFEVAPGATNWTQLSNAGVYSGVTTTTLTISNIAGLTGYQYYVQVRENGATCYTASHAVMITGVSTVTWNGSAWTPSPPTATTPVVIDGNYSTASFGSFEACSLTINNTRTLTISPNTYVSVVNDLTVASGANLQVQDDGSLVMVDNAGVVTNNGTTQIARTTSPFNKFDYTYWSSPVVSATLGAAMAGWRLDYSWTFNTANYSDVTGPNGTGPADGFDDNNDTWTFAGAGATMFPAKGYAVMGPTTLGVYPATSTVAFSGAVNNGVVNVPLAVSANASDSGDDYNLVGNPYPSAIFADTFINQNTNISGTLLFWTHSTPVSNTAPGPYQYNFVTADYAMYNLSGGVASANGSTQPTGYVASGQGFFVEAITAGNLVFNNGMRSKTYNNSNFYRNANNTVSAPDQKDRVWLNFEHSIGLFSQQLVCYSGNATLGVDRGYDGMVIDAGNSVSFYSFIEGEKYRIQGRPAFDVNDIVPLGLATKLPGSYTISIEHAEGILEDPSVPIYLEDKLLHVIHDLKQGPYVFDVPLGASNERFQLRYTDTSLGSPQQQLATDVLVFSQGSEVIVKAANQTVSEVEIFDMLGRRLYSKNAVDSESVSIPLSVQEQALLVRVTLSDGTNATRKIVH